MSCSGAPRQVTSFGRSEKDRIVKDRFRRILAVLYFADVNDATGFVALVEAQGADYRFELHLCEVIANLRSVEVRRSFNRGKKSFGRRVGVGCRRCRRIASSLLEFIDKSLELRNRIRPI